MDHTDQPASGPQNGELAAGCFTSWLRRARHSLLTGRESAVPCGDCRGCCSSFYFIHIRPEEKETLSRLNRRLLFPAPGLPKGHRLMGHFEDGACPMRIEAGCRIYAHRPATCRMYDCRVFAAAGIAAGDDRQETINRRVRQWRFSYLAAGDLAAHEAVRAAGAFLLRVQALPEGRQLPSNPTQMALLALKTYRLFLPGGLAHKAASAAETAGAMLAEERRFESRRRA